MRFEIGLAGAVGAALLTAACGQQSAPVMPQQSDLSGNATAPAPAAAAAPPAADLTKKLLAELPAPYNTGDLVNGKVQFSKCMACHTAVADGPDLTGPGLFGIFGRKSATKSSFAYSDAMKKYNVVWDAPKIDHWIEQPMATLPGTKMIFVGIKTPKDRIDAIAYLKVVSGGGPQ